MFTMLVGEIDAVPGTGADAQDHKISTRFFSFVGPLVPFQSMCVTWEHFEQHGRSSTHSYQGEDVRLNFASIALGYLRVWLGIAVFALPFVLYWGKSVESSMFIPSGYALAALIVALVVPGLLTRERKRKLGVLRRVVGLGCDPSFRYPYRRDEATESLVARLGEAGVPTSAEVALECVPSLGTEALELLFATAWYQVASKKPEWKPVMTASWARLGATKAA